MKMTEKLNPGHVDVIAKAAFLEKGKELVAELKSRTGGFAGRERLRKELMNRSLIYGTDGINLMRGPRIQMGV